MRNASDGRGPEHISRILRRLLLQLGFKRSQIDAARRPTWRECEITNVEILSATLLAIDFAEVGTTWHETLHVLTTRYIDVSKLNQLACAVGVDRRQCIGSLIGRRVQVCVGGWKWLGFQPVEASR